MSDDEAKSLHLEMLYLFVFAALSDDEAKSLHLEMLHLFVFAALDESKNRFPRLCSMISNLIGMSLQKRTASSQFFMDGSNGIAGTSS